MTAADPSDLASEAIAAIEDVGDRLEHVFAEVGAHLGTAHPIFVELNSGLNSLSGELSGAGIEGASVAFQNIAARLHGLADALPVETALLATIGAGATEASGLLEQLIQHIYQITVIARSSRIEAASLEGNRDDFLSFTREASELAGSVQSSIVDCSKEQERLAEAIAEALDGQLAFEKQYRDQLISVSGELISTFSEIKHLQAQGAEVAKLAKASTLQIGDAAGVAIVSLQAGDSTRQRLEHICSGLRKASNAGGGTASTVASLICLLQGGQLNDSVSEFEVEIRKISGSLTRLSADSAGIVAHGDALTGGKRNNMSAFIEVMKQRLAEASVLIVACGEAKIPVDASIATLEGVLLKFRAAISALDETVVDITLIGMNAGLKASHLGVKGRAFVVIANELKQTADRISAAAKMLEPVLLKIGQAADQLKSRRLEEESRQMSGLEHSIAQAVGDIEGGNDRLVQLMAHLNRESSQFESLMAGGRKVMSDVGLKFSGLSRIATRLTETGRGLDLLSVDEGDDAQDAFDEVYAQYTMERERQVHRKMSSPFGLICAPPMEKPKADSEDVLFF
jgi:hypothetical protein